MVVPAKPERVLAVVKAVGYAPNGMARGLASRPHGVTGLIFPDLDDPSTESGHETLLYSDEVIRGAERSARAAGYAILIAATHGAGGRALAQAVGPRVECRARGRRDRTVDHLRGGALRRDVALDEFEIRAGSAELEAELPMPGWLACVSSARAPNRSRRKGEDSHEDEPRPVTRRERS